MVGLVVVTAAVGVDWRGDHDILGPLVWQKVAFGWERRERLMMDRAASLVVAAAAAAPAVGGAGAAAAAMQLDGKRLAWRSVPACVCLSTRVDRLSCVRGCECDAAGRRPCPRIHDAWPPRGRTCLTSHPTQ